MKYDQLIKHCLDIMGSYNPIVMSLDSYADLYIEQNLKKAEETEKVFIKQVFYGTSRYEQFLRVLTESLFRLNPSQTNIKDQNLYFVVGYLICFRFDELPFVELQKIILSQEAVKMNVFFNYLFNITALNENARQGWLEIYDKDFVDNKIIGKLEDRLGQVSDLLEHLSEKATGKKSQVVNELQGDGSGDDEIKIKKKDPTKQIPFNLTQPKPKKIPEPIKIPKVVERKQIPPNLFKTSLQQIDEEKKKRREEIKNQIQQGYENNTEKPFQFELDKRPTNLEKISQEVEEKKKKELQFDNAYYKPPPNFKEPTDIKLNVAAILREEKNIQKKIKEDEQKIKDLEWNMRDSAEFDNWKKEQSYKDRIQLLEYQQRKKIEMELAREAAMRAAEEKCLENKQTAEEMKKISEQGLKLKEEKEEENFKKRQQLIEGVLETRDNATKEKEKLVEEKKKIHDESKKQMEILMEKKKEEEAAEKKKKEELIREIRELEKQPKKRTKGFDPTETSGLGLLNEMSIFELRERLEQVKREQLEQQEKIRQENLNKKDKQLSSLKEKVNLIKEQRETNKKEKEEERIQRKQKEQQEAALKQQIKEQTLLEVHSKIADKKTKKKNEEERLQKEFRDIKLKRQYMNANAAIVEEKAWKSQQDGAEREAKTRQVVKLIEQEQKSSIQFKEIKVLAEHAKTVMGSKIQSNQDYDERMEKANKENELMHRQLREYKKQMHDSVKESEQQIMEKMRQMDPFKYEMAQYSLNNAKELLQKQNNNTYNYSVQDQLPKVQFYEQNHIKEEIENE